MIQKSTIVCLFIVLIIGVLTPSSAQAEPSCQGIMEALARIEIAKTTGEITVDEAALYKLALFSQPEKLPTEFQPAATILDTSAHDRSDGLIILAHIHAVVTEDWELLSAETRQTIEDHFSLQAQVEKSAQLQHNLPNTQYTAHFAIHWNSDPTSPDYPVGGFQYIEILSNTLEINWTNLTVGLGYAEPILPVTPLPVYVASTIEFGWITLPPTVPAIGLPDQIQFKNNLNQNDLDTLGLHELFHVFQWDYADQDDFDFFYYTDNCWWMEATAVWMEHHVYNTDYIWLIRRYIDYTYRSLIRTWDPLGDEAADHPEYGVVVFAKYLEEHIDNLNTIGNNGNVIREVWENVPQVSGYTCLTAMENVLARYGHTLSNFFVHFTLANYLHATPSVGYQDGGNSNWPAVGVKPEHQHELTLTSSSVSRYDTLAPHAANYVEINSNMPYHPGIRLHLDLQIDYSYHDVRLLLFGPNLTAPEERVITPTYVTPPGSWQFAGDATLGFGTIYTKAVMIINAVQEDVDLSYSYDFKLEPPPALPMDIPFTPCRVFTLSADKAAQYPAVVYNPAAAEHLVVWELYRGLWNVYLQGQRMRQGTLVSAPFTLTLPMFNDTAPDSALASSSRTANYLVAWTATYEYSSWYYPYAQLWTSTGLTLNLPMTLSDTPIHYYHHDAPAIAYNETANQYLVVWANAHYIYGQLLSATTGVTVNQNLTLPAYYTAVAHPTIASNTQDSQYMIVWIEHTDTHNKLWCQRLDNQGNLIATPLTVATMIAPDTQPQVVYNSSAREYMVVWRDQRWYSPNEFPKTDIYAQRLSANGIPLDNPATTTVDESTMGVNFAISYGNDYIDKDPAIAYHAQRGEYLIAWERSGNICLQRVSTDGQLLDASFLLAVGNNDQFAPVISADGTDKSYLVVWQEQTPPLIRKLGIRAAFYPESCLYLPLIQTAIGSRSHLITPRQYDRSYPSPFNDTR